MKIPELKIDKLIVKIPVVQGGMAIRLSTGRLAGSVAAEGGIGLIAATGMGFDELRSEIKIARELSHGNGAIGINAMVAATEFLGLIKTAAEEKIDLFVAGAGFSRDIFAIGRDNGIPVVPIVSSAKLAKISQKLGASAVVVEGTEAGGHLGTQRSVKDILPEVVAAVNIPVIAAGSIVDGRGVAEMLELGASGVQMGSRFAASFESNGAPALKEYYMKMTEDDIVQIDSPVGYKGRAFKNAFVERLLAGDNLRPSTCQNCLKSCSRSFCIIKALIRAQEGDVETGLIFTGSSMCRIKEILSVHEIFNNIKEGILNYKRKKIVD